MMIEYLRKFGKESGKEFGKEYGTHMCSKEIKDMKMKLESIKKNMELLIVVVIFSWLYFVAF